MAKTWWETGSLRRINIPVPNDDLAKWLKGSKCRKAVEEVTSQIHAYYQNSLPVSRKDKRYPKAGTRNLKRHADYYVEIGGWGVKQDRWFGWITNTAMSYRPAKNQPYAGTVEYGNASRNIPAGNQLREAAAKISAEISGGARSLPGVQYEPAGRGSTLRGDRGRFVANPLAYDRNKKSK